MAAPAPAKLSAAEQPFDLNQAFSSEQSYIENLIATQTKGFVVMHNNQILAEYYANGYQRGMTNNLQSASKTFAGLIISQLADQGLLDLDKSAKSYLPELSGSVLGAASVRDIANMASGIEALGDYHTPGSKGYMWELEIGLQSKGQPQDHLKAIKAAEASGAAAGTKWEYSDQNTDALGLIAERVSGKSMSELLTDLARNAGYQHLSSIALTSDGTTSPAFGIDLSALDYALFHQYIAEGKAGATYYQTATDLQADVMREHPAGNLLAYQGANTAYGMQTYYFAEENILMSFGSFGQMGFSDLSTGISVVNQSDWSINADIDKAPQTIQRSIQIIKQLRSQLQ